MKHRKSKSRVRNFGCWCVSCLVLCGPSAFGTAETNALASTNTPAAPQPAPPVSGALSSDVEALIQILQTKYVHPAQVADVEMNKAAVQGIVAALQPGAELVSANATVVPTNQPPLVRAESVASLIGYVRLDKLDAATLKEFDSALNKLDGENIDSLVLDLRFTKGGSYSDAAELVSRFLLKDKKLFSTQSQQPANAASYTTTQPSAYIDWKIAVLINGETEGASEAVAGALREQARAIVIGTTSAGKAVVWSEETLPSGAKVRIATGKVVLASGTELFPKGLTPDIPVGSRLEEERKVVFELSLGKQMREFVEEQQSEKRLNEAALVRMLGKGATNNAATATGEEKKDESQSKDDKEKDKKKTPLPRDVALQRAVDILKGIRILHLD